MLIYRRENNSISWNCDVCRSPMDDEEILLVSRENGDETHQCFTLHETCIQDLGKVLLTDTESAALRRASISVSVVVMAVRRGDLEFNLEVRRITMTFDGSARPSPRARSEW